MGEKGVYVCASATHYPNSAFPMAVVGLALAAGSMSLLPTPAPTVPFNVLQVFVRRIELCENG